MLKGLDSGKVKLQKLELMLVLNLPQFFPLQDNLFSVNFNLFFYKMWVIIKVTHTSLIQQYLLQSHMNIKELQP